MPHTKLVKELSPSLDIVVNGFLPSTDSCIFNSIEYFRLHSSSDKDSFFQLVEKKLHKVFVTICFYYDPDSDSFISPKKGTFGGVSLSSDVSFEYLELFLDAVLDFLRSYGVRGFEIKCPPITHDQTTTSIFINYCMRKGLCLSTPEINYDLAVNNNSSFYDHVDYGNMKRIKKALREGFFASQLDNSLIVKVYEVLEKSRARKGYSLSMTLIQLEEMINIFAKKIVLFGVYDGLGVDLVASAFCIRLSKTVFYVFYWGDSGNLKGHSPLALLASEIYKYCQHEDIKILDVGISTLKGVPNYGLHNFKKNLGFRESLKFTLSGNLK